MTILTSPKSRKQFINLNTNNMKKLFFLAVAAIALFTSCATDDAQSAAIQMSEDFTAVVAGGRAELDGTAVYWNDGDELTIFTRTALNRQYRVKSIDSSKKVATFGYVAYTGSDATAIAANYAIYPYNPAATLNGDVITTTLPAEQAFNSTKVDLVYAPMAAKSTTTDFAFVNTTGLLRFKVKMAAGLPDLFTLQSIKAESAANALAGTATIDLSDDAQAVIAIDGNESKVVTLSGINAEIGATEALFYMALPATQFAADDLKVTFVFAEGAKEFILPAFDLTQSKIKTINYTINPDDFTGSTGEYGETVELAQAEPAQVAAALTEALANPEVGQVILPEMPAGQELQIELTSTLTFGAAGRAAEAIPARNLIIDGNGATITFTGANRMVDVTKEAAGANLTLKNLTLVNGQSWMERGVNYNTNGKLVLDNVKIINAENCSNNYAVNLPGSSDGAQVVINNSEIWAGANALNIWGEAIVANITNSKLYVVDKNPVEGYAVISVNNDGVGNAAHNSIINIEGGEIKVVYEGEGEAMPSSAIRDASNGSVINISESTVVVGEIKIPVVNVVYEGYDQFYSFSTLQAAIDKVQQDNNGMVRLVKNLAIAETVTIKKGGNVAIDLNGFTVSGVNNADQGHLFMVENGATLTIKDQSQAQTGKITYAQGTSNVGWTIDLNGTLNLESGTLELTGNWGIGYAVDVRPNSWGTEFQEATTFNMSGGKIVSSDGAIRVASSSDGSHAKVSANFNMTGGEIEAGFDGIFIQQSDTVYDVLNVNISNGTLKSTLYPIRLYGPVATSKIGNSSLKISGGTFSKVNVAGSTALIEDFIYIGGGISADTLYHTQIAITGGSFVDGSALPSYILNVKEL